MKKIMQKCLSSLVLVTLLLSAFSISAFAQSVNLDDHELNFKVPNGYVLLDKETAEENEDIIESLGYTVDSFKKQLDTDKEDELQTFFFCIEPESGTQISLKSWQTEFSKETIDFSQLSDEALTKAAKELVTVKGAAYKNVSVNGLNLIEIAFSGEDSGGKFSSVQYLTVRNKRFYSLNIAFGGELDSKNADFAWETVKGLNIENQYAESPINVQTILMIILIGALLLCAVVFGVIIIMSFVKDIKKKQNENKYGNEYIERRKGPFDN